MKNLLSSVLTLLVVLCISSFSASAQQLPDWPGNPPGSPPSCSQCYYDYQTAVYSCIITYNQSPQTGADYLAMAGCKSAAWLDYAACQLFCATDGGGNQPNSVPLPDDPLAIAAPKQPAVIPWKRHRAHLRTILA